jgi:hypothetical protein
MKVKYERAGLLPSGGPQTGTTALRDLICDEFIWCPRLSFYVARDTTGHPVKPDGSGRVSSLSLHAEGRAFDAMTSDRTKGDPLADWCLTNSEALQIQEVIWQRRIWTSQSQAWHDYTGASPHTDHVHIGQSWFGAQHPEIVDTFRGQPANTNRIVRRVADLPPVGLGATMRPNEFLRLDESRRSDNQQFTFVHQADGNLVLYDADGKPRWSSGTVSVETDLLIMQDDGNLVLYKHDGTALWNSQTAGHPGAQLEVRDDGRIVVVSTTRTELFAKP